METPLQGMRETVQGTTHRAVRLHWDDITSSRRKTLGRSVMGIVPADTMREDDIVG